ncbi:MAG: aminoacyl-tRNA hydrolase [Atopobiaceae bacterium]|jgi:PTH1 family peptidyl-tRNA hydrolase
MVKPLEIKLVCGLGNPGAEYERTRHNAGFVTVDELAARYNVRYWKSEAGCMVAPIHAGGREVLLAKPESYMNTSGGPLSKLMRAHGIGAQEILVVHDEVDLPAGTLEVKFSGGLNAHNGLRSIADKINTRDFSRLRFGVGRPPGKMSVADFALRTLKGAFWEEFCVSAADAADLVERCLIDGVASQLGKH